MTAWRICSGRGVLSHLHWHLHLAYAHNADLLR